MRHSNLLKARERVEALKNLYRHLIAYFVINLLLISIRFFNLGEDEEFFTFCTFNVAFWWGITIVFHVIGVFGKSLSFSKKWEERKVEEYMKRQERTSKWE